MNKKLEKIKQLPPRSDIKMDDLIGALESIGFICRPGKGSHYIFKHSKYPELYTTIPSPHGGDKCVKKPYIRMVQELIREIEDKSKKGE